MRNSMHHKRKILCTLGPSSMNLSVIKKLELEGVDIFRLNLSHIKFEDLEGMIRFLQDNTKVSICLDTEGAQVRTGDFLTPSITVRENSIVKVYNKLVPGDPYHFNLYPLDIAKQLELNDFISIDFNSVFTQVISKDQDGVKLRVINGGVIGKNKAVTIEKHLTLGPLTEKDKKSLILGKSLGIKHVALSFANRESDISAIKEFAGSDIFLISKIECLNGIKNLEGITNLSDAILIDRGDLSREVSIQKIPALQKHIIKTVKSLNKDVYVATNLLESMITSSTPTRAEVNDVYGTLQDGADGLVMAAETAIGKYPVDCVKMVKSMIFEFENRDNINLETVLNAEGLFTSRLIAPHGGKLINQQFVGSADDLNNNLKRLVVSTEHLMDCEQIAVGTYSPLTGFMGKVQLQSVLENYRLENGLTWTMPILLPITAQQASSFSIGETIILENEKAKNHSLLKVEEIYEFDLRTLVRQWFLTESNEHPGVRKVIEAGGRFIAGTVHLVNPIKSEVAEYELTPAQTRLLFAKRGWETIVGFHTRNVPHRAHEFIQLEALKIAGADGLFISPVIGPKKKGDFLAKPILGSYQQLLDFAYYPESKIVLGSFSTYSRYSGPREAVFTALCRKNMGCTHFIIGRDHTGVGHFYTSNQTTELFTKLGDVGIKPIFFDEVAYNPLKQSYENISKDSSYKKISGTEVRNMLLEKKQIPDWFMRTIVQDYLSELLNIGDLLFY
jgi:ATP sulfurylase